MSIYERLYGVHESRWFEYVPGEGWVYRKTEDHVFAAYSPDGGKRIGDMSREELLHVIAVGYHRIDQMAAALCRLADVGYIAKTQLHGVIDDARLTAHIADMDEQMGEVIAKTEAKQNAETG